MATEKEKETTKRTSTKKGSSAESAEKKVPQKKRPTTPKDPPRKKAPKATKTGGKKAPATKSKTTKAATPQTAAKPRSNVKAAQATPSVTQSAEEQTAATAATDAPPAEEQAPSTPPAAQGPSAQAPAPAAEKSSPPPAEDTAPSTEVPQSDAVESDPADTGAGRTQPPPPPEPSAAAENGRNVSLLVYLGLGLLLVVSLIVFASLFNMNHYHLKHHNGALEIWRGKFSPKGIERLVIMPGVAPPEEIKPVYTKEEVYPIALQYYIDKADTLMGVSGLPDFKGIKADLKRARSYALNDAQRQIVQERLNRIELTALLYKADVAAGKGSLDDLNMAKKYLNQAAQHDPDEFEAKLIAQKLASIDALMAVITQEPAVPPPTKPEAATDTEIPADGSSSQPQPKPETAETPEPPTQHSESQ